MGAVVHSLVSTSKTVLSERIGQVSFILLLPVVAGLLYLIPVVSIPGNDVAFQWQLMVVTDVILLGIVTVLESLLLVMLLHLFRKRDLTVLNRGNLGIVSSVPAFLFGTNFCPICIASILGLFGPGVVAFAVDYQIWIFGASAALLLLSLYSTSRRVHGECEQCV